MVSCCRARFARIAATHYQLKAKPSRVLSQHDKCVLARGGQDHCGVQYGECFRIAARQSIALQARQRHATTPVPAAFTINRSAKEFLL